MTHTRQYADSEGTFAGWQDHPQPCNRAINEDANGGHALCGAKVQVRAWESTDGSYEDYQYRCAVGHTWWIDGIDS